MNTLIGLGFACAILFIAYCICRSSKKEQPKQPVKTIKYYDDEGNEYQ
ncbi:MAG: hypothetical protein KBD57_09905 [Bacteroidia bacterium]|nr:hypothetical protein [Bacteroidia bacterium]